MTAQSARLFLDSGPAAAPSRAATVLLTLAVAAAYALTGYGGLKLAFIGNAVTLFWPPSGIAFAAVWMGGMRFVPAVVLGAFSINLWVFGSPWPAALVALGNTLPALASTLQLRRIMARRPDAGELQRVIAFIVVAALLSTLLSASAGTLVVLLFTTAPWSAAQSTWIVWWMGDAMGVLIVAPPILLWRRMATAPLGTARLLDIAAFAGLGLGIIAGLLLIRNPIWAVELCKLFTLLLSLWAGARFGLTGPALMTLLMAFGAIGVTMLGVGPFIRGDFYDRFALVHSYLFAEAVAGMLLAAALADLQRALVAATLARAEAESASANRVRLLNMISHDVRTPLSGMLGVLQTLARGELPGEAQRSVALGLRAGASLTKLVNDILDVARADAGRIRLDPYPFDPAQSLHDLVRINQLPAEAKGLQLRLAIDGALPARVLGDRVRFEQIVGNLVTNAVAYTPAGDVSVAARWHAPTGRLHVEVADTGPGIDHAGDSAVFDAFASGARPGSSAGLGLGLRISQALVSLMDGEISYRGRSGRGSCFLIELPLPAVAAAAAEAPVARLPAETPRARHVLLVEDDLIACETAAALLRSHGHQVATAGDATSAVVLAGSQHFDVVLMDIQLGVSGGSGLDAARQIRALPPPACRVRIVALTGDSADATDPAFGAAGIDGVWVKPLLLNPAFLALIDAT